MKADDDDKGQAESTRRRVLKAVEEADQEPTKRLKTDEEAEWTTWAVA